MSYSRSYQHTTPVHGTITVHYPASEHGGSMTVSYSDAATVNVNILVDTDPFDESIDRTIQSTDGLTVAIAAMEGAQIASIKKSAQKVSDSMINGFFNLTQKDLTAQKSEESSRIQSKFALLIATTKALQEKRSRMDQDLSRIQGHYYKIFKGLDDSLEKRIRELDHPAFALGQDIHNELLVQPAVNETAYTLDQSASTGNYTNMLTTARLYNRISGVLNSITSYVMKCVDYKNDVMQTLESTPVQGQESEFVPTILCERKSLTEQGTMEYESFVPELKSQSQIQSRLDQEAYGDFQGQWGTPAAEELSQIDQAFSKYVEEAFQEDDVNDPVRSRVYQETLHLWQTNLEKLKSL